MILPSLLTVVLASLVGTSFAQGSTPIVYDSIHNATVIVGTWSSGSKAVQTGSVSRTLRTPWSICLTMLLFVGG